MSLKRWRLDYMPPPSFMLSSKSCKPQRVKGSTFGGVVSWLACDLVSRKSSFLKPNCGCPDIIPQPILSRVTLTTLLCGYLVNIGGSQANMKRGMIGRELKDVVKVFKL